MQIAELFAALKIRPDRLAFAKAQQSLSRFAQAAQTRMNAMGVALGRAFGRVQGTAVDAFSASAEEKISLLSKKMVALMGGLAAGSAFVAATRDAIDFDEALTRLTINSQGAMGSMEELRARVLEVAKATGLAKEQILAGAGQFVALTGDGKAAAASMETFARIAQATGARMEDIASSAAAMTQNLGIGAAEFEKAFSIVIRGGKEGAVELRDMAGLLAELSPLAERFAGGGGIEGLSKLSAALQLTRQGFGSASEAATGLQSLMGAIVKNASRIEKAGVQVFTVDEGGTKRMRALDDIVEDISNSKLAKDPTALIQALGRKEAEQAFIQLTKVKGAWSELAEATLDANDVAEDYAKFQQSASARIKKAWNAIKVAVTTAMAPVVEFLAFLAEHGTLVLVVLGSMALAFIALKGAAITSAIAAAAAWAAALLPFILLSAAIAALVLILNDLWNAFTGGQSVIADFALQLERWWNDWVVSFDEIVEFWKETFIEFFDWIVEQVKNIPNKIASGVSNFFTSIGDEIADFFGGDADEGFSGVVNRKIEEVMTPPTVSAPPAAPGVRMNAQFNITQQPGEDGESFAIRVRDLVRDLLDGEVEAAAAATGG